MSYQGDIAENNVLTFSFPTRGLNSAPATLAGSPVLSVYKDTDLTQSVTGITLSVDHDSITGLNNVEIDTSDAFYATLADYSVVITTGTVDGVSVVGAVVGTFSIENRSQPAISSGSSAVNKVSESYTLTTGTQSANTYTDTFTLDDVNHAHTDDGGELELYYQFDVGGDGVPVSIHIIGRLNSANDSLDGVYAYNWGNTTWDRLGAYAGQGSATNTERDYSLLTTHVGTGTDLGKVRIRFYAASGLSSATLSIDHIFIAYSIVSRSVGYSDGAIWVNTNGSNTNTEAYVDGTADNPVSTWAAALTLSSSLNIKRFHMINGSAIQLSANSDTYTLFGQSWSLDLNSQSIDGIHVIGADVEGIGTNGSLEPEFKDCHFGDVSLPPCHLCACGFGGTFTMLEAGTYYFDQCHSSVAGEDTPVIDYGAGLDASDLNMRRYSGGTEIRNMGAGTGSYRMSLEGHGQLIIAASCSATSLIAIRGHFTITDNASGAVTLSDDARYDQDQILEAITDDATKLDGSALNAIPTTLGTPADMDGGGATLSDNLKKIADDNAGADFNSTTDSLQAIRDRGDIAWITAEGAGAGSVTWSHTVTNENNGEPISDVDITVRAVVDGPVVASAQTNAVGVATFYLDPGTYYFYRQKSGWDFTNPDTEVVS